MPGNLLVGGGLHADVNLLDALEVAEVGARLVDGGSLRARRRGWRGRSRARQGWRRRSGIVERRGPRWWRRECERRPRLPARRAGKEVGGALIRVGGGDEIGLERAVGGGVIVGGRGRGGQGGEPGEDGGLRGRKQQGAEVGAVGAAGGVVEGGRRCRGPSDRRGARRSLWLPC